MQIHNCDVLEALAAMPDSSVNCIVTSPPYWGLRDYKVDGQIGLEPTPEAYIEKMAAVFRECRRVLTDDGTFWLNVGDSYASSSKGTGGKSEKQDSNAGSRYTLRGLNHGVKDKDMVGIPWMLAFALRADGWYLRADIIWAKPNPMPESVRDRPTKSHEHIFLLTKSAKYYYDADAISEECITNDTRRPSGVGQVDNRGNGRDRGGGTPRKQDSLNKNNYTGFNERWKENPVARKNSRDVWTITPSAYKGAHFAVFPPEIPRRCISAGCPPGGTVLDPFAGSGTTLAVALELGRVAIGIELNPDYIPLIRERVGKVQIGLGKMTGEVKE